MMMDPELDGDDGAYRFYSSVLINWNLVTVATNKQNDEQARDCIRKGVGRNGIRTVG